MKKKFDITPVCDKCGKTAPIDKEKSNETWICYRVKDLCECGGKFKPKCLLEED